MGGTVADVTATDVPWPAGWRIAPKAGFLILERKQRWGKAFGSLALGLFLLVTAAEIQRQEYFGRSVSSAYFSLQSLFPPWHQPYSVISYVRALFNLVALLCLVTAVWCVFGKVRYTFSPDRMERRTSLFGWSREQNFRNSQLFLKTFHDALANPDFSTWYWQLLAVDSGGHAEILSDQSEWGNLPLEVPKSIVRKLARVTHWPVKHLARKRDRPSPG